MPRAKLAMLVLLATYCLFAIVCVGGKLPVFSVPVSHQAREVVHLPMDSLSGRVLSTAFEGTAARYRSHDALNNGSAPAVVAVNSDAPWTGDYADAQRLARLPDWPEAGRAAKLWRRTMVLLI